MPTKENNYQTLLEYSSFKTQDVYAFKLNNLTLIYPQKTESPKHPILSFNGLRLPSMPKDAVIIPFLFDTKTSLERYVPIQTPFMLYVPSLLTLWAIAAQKQNSSLIQAVISENTLSNSFLIYFKWRLYFERFRLGSDVESFFARRLLYRDRFGANMPHISIKQWLEWIKISTKTI